MHGRVSDEAEDECADLGENGGRPFDSFKVRSMLDFMDNFSFVVIFPSKNDFCME